MSTVFLELVLLVSLFAVDAYHVQNYGRMDINSGALAIREDARAVIEEVARRKGTFTHAFRREAEQEAKDGRKGMLQAIQGSEEIREDLAKALKM